MIYAAALAAAWLSLFLSLGALNSAGYDSLDTTMRYMRGTPQDGEDIKCICGIRRITMVNERKLRELLNVSLSGTHARASEGETLDFKRDPYRLGENPGKDADFIKDILAMANTPREETSYIIIGVTNETKELVGVSEGHPDDANLQQYMNRAKVEPIPAFHYQIVSLDGLSYGVIEIPVRNNGPYLPTADFGGVKSQDLYYRQGSLNAKAQKTEQRNEIHEWFFRRRLAQRPPSPSIENTYHGSVYGVNNATGDSPKIEQHFYVGEGSKRGQDSE